MSWWSLEDLRGSPQRVTLPPEVPTWCCSKAVVDRGGRVLQTTLEDGRIVQLGGEVIGASADSYRQLVDELGLTLVPAFPGLPGADTTVLTDGHFVDDHFGWMGDEDKLRGGSSRRTRREGRWVPCRPLLQVPVGNGGRKMMSLLQLRWLRGRARRSARCGGRSDRRPGRRRGPWISTNRGPAGPASTGLSRPELLKRHGRPGSHRPASSRNALVLPR